jgi:hypothetical protein
MTTDRDAIDSLVVRLEILENRYRHLKDMVAVLLILAVGATTAAAYLVMRKTWKARTVEVRKLVLVDRNGNVRAKLAVDEHETLPGGTIRSEPDPNLSLFDSSGKLRASLWAKDGDVAGLLLFDANVDQDRVALWAFQDKDGAALTIHDAKGTKRAELVATPREIGLRFFDESGKVIFSRP